MTAASAPVVTISASYLFLVKPQFAEACAAELEFVLRRERAIVPITYTTELVEDARTDFYVTVHGL